MKEEDDEYVGLIEAALRASTDAMTPGRYLVEVLPFLKYVPTWVPGAYTQRLFVKWRTVNVRAVEKLFEYVATQPVEYFAVPRLKLSVLII